MSPSGNNPLLWFDKDGLTKPKFELLDATVVLIRGLKGCVELGIAKKIPNLEFKPSWMNLLGVLKVWAVLNVNTRSGKNTSPSPGPRVLRHRIVSCISLYKIWVQGKKLFWMVTVTWQ